MASLVIAEHDNNNLKEATDKVVTAPAQVRVPVQMLLDHLKHGETIEDFLEGAPSVSRQQAELFLELAAEHLVECVSS